MSPTRSLVLSGSISSVAALAAYGLLRVLGQAVPNASFATCVFASAVFLAGAVIVRSTAGSFTVPASAAIVGGGATMIVALMAASRSTDAFGLLIVGFILGVAVSVFALMKDLDEHTSPKLLLFVPMGQLAAFLTVFGL